MATPLGAALAPLPVLSEAAFLDYRDRLCHSEIPADAPVDALASVAALSPHLARLMTSDPAALQRVLCGPIEATLARATEANGSPDCAAVSHMLRTRKHEIALAVALADLCAGASLASVTTTLSRFADHAVSVALASALAEAHAQGQIDVPDPETSGIVVLALGKLGAHELNYSSDIDLVVLFDPERARRVGIDQTRAVRLTRRLNALVGERTDKGYVFRVDLRLRPDPGSTPLAVSTRKAITYMQRDARPWERQAMIKARQIAGDRTAGAAYLRAVDPTVWRSGYDFGAIDETFQMRQQIALLKGVGGFTVPGHNVKIGRGGIREIEFLVQTLQRVAGGRDARLRGRQTLAMLTALTDRGWLHADMKVELREAYERLRKVEHRLQMVADEQTHTLPREADLPRIAAMMREDDFEERMRLTFETVHKAFHALPSLAGRASPMLARLAPRGASAQARAEVNAAFERWQVAPYPSLKTERARALLRDIQADVAAEIASASEPSEALSALDRFFAKLPGGVEALERLRLHRELIPALVLILSASPRLVDQLARRAHVLDVLIDPTFFGNPPDRDTLSAELAERLEAAPDYEDKLDALRTFGQEQALFVEVRILTGSLSGRAASEATTELAEVVTGAALQIAQDAFVERHGRLKDGAACLLALGKFGSAEMTATSDLDIVFLYDCAPDAGGSDGAKSLSPGHYYTRLAQRFIAALAAPTARGMLYEVDLRLRPSGKAGPIATHIRSFERYHDESAWTWEHMALTRARVVAGDEALGVRAMAAIHKALGRSRDPVALAASVAGMRERIADNARDDFKHAVGGLIDIEFVAQYLALKSGKIVGTTDTRRILRGLSADDALSNGDLETLLGALILMQKLAQLFAVFGGPVPIAEAPATLQRLLVRAGEAPDAAFLSADLSARREAVREVYERVVADVAAAAPDAGDPTEVPPGTL